MCNRISPTAHLQSGHPTTKKAESITESSGWIQGWHVTFHNHWKTKPDGCQLYLIFHFPPRRVDGSDLTLKHPLWLTHDRQEHSCSTTRADIVQSQEEIQQDLILADKLMI